jgi:hypothetical protein
VDTGRLHAWSVSGLVAVMAFSLGGLTGFEGASDSEEVEVAVVAPVTVVVLYGRSTPNSILIT